MQRPSPPPHPVRSGRNRRGALALALGCAGAVAAKLWLVQCQALEAHATAWLDDRLYLDLARHLLAGEWLGPYDNATLAKSPFYPLWMAACHRVGVPLLLAQHALYAAACAALVLALAPCVRSRWPLVGLFGLLLFDPKTYDVQALRVVREGIYPALTLLTFAGMIGALLRWRGSKRSFAAWLGLWGAAVSALWLTREEGIWILPSAVFTAGCIGAGVWRAGSQRVARLALLLAPWALLGLSVAAIEAINWRVYGAPVVSELKAPEFERAYGALTRVAPRRWRPQVPVARETRRRIYAQSPAFAELRGDLEGWLGQRWSRIGRPPGATPHDGEIYGTSFYWALRDAAARAGHHATAVGALAYYARLAREVNAACAEGRLRCGPDWASLIPRWRAAYLGPLLRRLGRGLRDLATLADLEPDPHAVGWRGTRNPRVADLFESVTLDRVARFDPAPPAASGRMGWLEALTAAYRLAFPAVCAAALLGLAAAGALAVARRRADPLLLASVAVVGGALTRCLGLAYMSVSSSDVMNQLYMAPVYPLVSLSAFSAALALAALARAPRPSGDRTP